MCENKTAGSGSGDINFWLKNEPGNVVWEAADMADFRRILPAFLPSGTPVTYIRFSEKDPAAGSDFSVLPKGAETVRIPLSHRFETFTVAVSRTIGERPAHTFYLFDSLSELQTAWATDLMMKNFFCVITPLIRKKKATAFYPLIRGMHSRTAEDAILASSDFFLDLYADFQHLYMRPRKIRDLTSGSLYQPHRMEMEKGLFRPIRDGVALSHFHQALTLSAPLGRNRSMDSWDRFFEDVQRSYEDGEDVTEPCARMCQIMMTRDPHMRELIRKNFFPEDYFFVKEHMVGTGLIGGKACGMLTARKIIENRRPDICEKLEPHDSFYIGSDVFYSYIVENDLWDLRVKQRSPEGYFSLAKPFADGLLAGKFSARMEQDFLRLLDYYGQSPVIVRSSSILEDGFGNAFAGKYDSVFCANDGSEAERLAEFENAIRIVYASTMSPSALDYRKRRGLDNRDEQMALLVQRVSGAHYGRYFMPAAAGVGYSYSTYRFLKDLDPEAGMLRLVMGLGTSAVDRTEGSYPRLVSLDKPEATPYATQFEHRRYSQQNIEVIDKEKRTLVQIRLSDILPYLPAWLRRLLIEHDTSAERAFRERGQNREICFISCQGIVQNRQLMADMRDLMAAIAGEYEHPVDIEFTINFSESGEYVINLLQCRPLQAFRDTGEASVPENLPESDILVDTRHTSMGTSQVLRLDRILYVDPTAYYELPYSEKPAIARIIGAVNWYYRGKGKNLLLMVPGRVGTSSPELGVPTTFADISECKAIFEIAESKSGYNPELSYGSHIFQDLVENSILYAAVFEDPEHTRRYNPQMLAAFPDLLARIPGLADSAEKYGKTAALYDVSGVNLMLYNDMLHERMVVAIRRGTGK